MQIFPKAIKTFTHESIKALETYDSIDNAESKTIYKKFQAGTKVIILDEALGKKGTFSKIKLGDEELFCLSKSIKPLSEVKKISANYVITNYTRPSQLSPVIDWTLKQSYLPYENKRDGNFSVVVQSDFESIVNRDHLLVIAEKAFYDGMYLLLRSKGLRSSREDITNLLNTYFVFGFVEDYFVDTRKCMPIKFLVSIPLRFLEGFNIGLSDEKAEDQIQYTLTFNSLSIINRIDSLISVFNHFSNDIEDFLNPNGVITGFDLELEVIYIREFFKSFVTLLNTSGHAFNEEKNVVYDIGISKDYKIISVKYSFDGTTIEIPYSKISVFSSLHPLDSKRIINYYLNIDEILRFYQSYKMQDFIQKFVISPTPEFIKQNLVINEQTYTNEDIDSLKKALKDLDSKRFLTNEEKANTDAVLEAATDLVKRFSNSLIPAEPNVYAAAKFANEARFPTNYSERAKQRVGQLGEEFGEAGEGILDGARTGALNVAGLNDYDQLVALDKIRERENGKSSIPYFKIQVASRVITTFFRKLRAQELLLKILICKLQKLDPEDEETKRVLSQVGPELLQWFHYLSSLAFSNPGSLKKEDLENVSDSGINFAFSAFSKQFKSAEFLYYFYLAVQRLSVKNTADFKSSFLSTFKFSVPPPSRTRSTFSDITQAVISGLVDYLTNLLYEKLNELIDQSICKDESNPANSPFGLNNNIKNPFLSSAKNFDSNRSDEQQNLNSDRQEALANAGLFSDREPEESSDLLKALIEDISCVLTPLETCELLNGNVDETIIEIIKSIIRRKYLPEMQELLDNSKIKLLFKQMGKNVDPEVCNQINAVAATNPASPSLKCTPQQLEARKKLLQDKLPNELVNDELKNFNRRKAREAQDIIDTLANGSTRVLDVPLLCGKGVEGLASPVNATSLAAAKRQLETLFSSVYDDFNSDSDSWTSNYISDEVVEVRDPEDEETILLHKNVKIINKNLYLNLLDTDSSTLQRIENKYLYNLEVKNKYINPATLELIDNLPEQEGVDKDQLKKTINEIINKPLWNIGVVDNGPSYNLSIKRLENTFLDNFILQKTSPRPTTTSGQEQRILDAIFDLFKSSLTNSRLFEKTDEKTIYTNKDGKVSFEEKEDYKISRYIDGVPLINSFNLNKFPTAQQRACGIDPHFLNIKRLLRKALEDYKETICNFEEEPAEGRKKPNPFEKAALKAGITLFFRVTIIDYLTRALPIFSVFPITSLVNNKQFVGLLKILFLEDMKLYGERFTKEFKEYTDEYFAELKEKGLVTDYNDSYEYFISSEINFASRKISRELQEKKLINTDVSFSSDLNSFIKSYKFSEDSSEINDRIYLEEYIILEKEKFSYDVLTDFFTPLTINDDSLVGIGINLVRKDGSGKDIIVTYEKNLNISLDDLRESVGTDINVVSQFFGIGEQPTRISIDDLKKQAKEGLFQNEIFKVFNNNNDIFTFFVFYSILCTIDNQKAYMAYMQTKMSVYSVITSLIGDKGPNRKPYDGSSRDDIMAAIDKAMRSPFPMEEFSRNPELMRNGALEFFKAFIKIPIGIIKAEAEFSDPNISIASKISDGVQIPASIAWTFTNEEKRKELIKEAPLFFKRLRDNQRILPVFVPSFSLMPFLILPFPVGIAYLGINIIEEILYNIKLLQENEEEQTTSETSQANENKAKSVESAVCSPDIKKRLEMEVDGEV